jgi:glutamate---cysteine ligase / carboxylate-amine ligase
MSQAKSPQTENFTLGVEEEYQIIHPQTRQLWAQAQLLLPVAQSALGEERVKPEFRQSQVEIATPICHSLQDVRVQLVRLRGEVITAAAKEGAWLAAAGTHPFSHWQGQPLTPKPRYQELADNYQHLMQELVIFGCHVHVGLGDREMAVQVMNRARIWLAPLLALSASSPFWLGSDTGYASYRTTLASRLPMAGPPLFFDSLAQYDATVQALVAANTIQEATQICWDIRLSERYPTLEFRVTDVCLTVDEAVMLAGLIRGLVRTCYDQACSQKPYPVVRPELLRAAHWQAARYGLEAELIDIEAQRRVPAQQLVEQWLDWLRPALETFREWDDVNFLVQETLQRGTGAARQREVYRRTGSLEQTVDFIVQETAKGAAAVQTQNSVLVS